MESYLAGIKELVITVTGFLVKRVKKLQLSHALLVPLWQHPDES